MPQDTAGRRDVVSMLIAAVLLVAVAATRTYSFPLFHSLAEVFSIAVACGVFMVVWNARRVVQNSFLLVVGVGLLFVGIVDLLHMLAYEGMGVFTAHGQDLPVQLWIAARYLHAAAFLSGALLVRRRVIPELAVLLFAAATALLLLSIFAWGVFPSCYVAGEGLTRFKVISEYAICVVLLASLLLLIERRRAFDPFVLQLLAVSIVATIASEMAFTLYIGLYDPANMLGHLLKIVAYYLIYKAAIENTLLRPYEVLFSDLKRSEEASRASGVQFRRLVDESPDGFVVVNQEGMVRYANARAVVMLGRTASELVDSPLGLPVRPGTAAELDIPRKDGVIRARMRVVETFWEGEAAYLICLHPLADRPHEPAQRAQQGPGPHRGGVADAP